MERFLKPVVAQYLSHLQKLGRHEKGMTICLLQNNMTFDLIPSPHYLLKVCDEELLNHLVKFFGEHKVTPFLYVDDSHHVLSLAIVKEELINARLTSKDEGEFFYQLKVSLKQQQEAHDAENASSPSLRK
jgi:hypothetical protein